MAVTWLEGPLVEPVSVNEARAYLRIEGTEEDAGLAGFLKVARELCEAFTGQVLVATRYLETKPFDAGRSTGVPWSAGRGVRLSRMPLRQIMSATLVSRDGTRTVLGPQDFDIAEDARGQTLLRMTFLPPSGALLEVNYWAGMGSDWNCVPEALRQGILRLTAHLYAHRDRADDIGPPLAVAALWRPFRVGRLA